MKLRGRTALITGGSTGIGKEIALAYAREGADLAINYYKTKEEAMALKNRIEQEFGRKVMIVEGDVSEVDPVCSMVEATLENFGAIDILVNSAGITHQSPVTDLSVEDWDQMIKVNMRGPFLCVKFVLPHMLERKFGRIINIASQLGQLGGTENAHYAASKAGVIGFTKSVAREVSIHGITANCIAPGPIATPFLLEGYDEAWKERKQSSLPLGRFGRPEEVAPTAVLLASDPDGNLYTGQTLGPNSGDAML
ncbi:3-oxoacyl-ACP reductase [Mesobacillus campisalis]|uniref:3-oxoacyl-ACP reductase n=1 Tax=Mesobacillus campisalis TaxID=1408103 RepID=A0A0M2SWI7_9BACI|nr:3-oxoacyl-ACP reductase family protein [Mesobacillus campisalis]KKK38924.1 3-oxoacyl-ACP reductase [Mesobacillus campisalis]